MSATLVWLGLATLAGNSAQPKVHVAGHAFFTQQFGRWGGAAPTAEESANWERMNAEGRKPKPLAGQRLIVRAGKQNRNVAPVAEVTSAKDGTFTVELAPGSYCVVDAGAKRHPTPAGPYTDKACLEQAFAKCDAIWNVTYAEGQSFSVSFLRSANLAPPCYFGPSRPPPRHAGSVRAAK